MKKSLTKILAIVIIVGLNWAGLSAVIETFAYYSDNENSNNNLFQATIFDFSVTNRHIENFIGMEALSDIEFASVVMKKTGSLDIQYEVNVEKINGDDNFCNALKMEVEHNGVEKHDGLLLSFSAATTTELGTWEFELDLPVSATNVPHGAKCNVDLVFKGWRSDVVSFEESGFTDEERIELRLTSRMIVLNEFLPNPDGVAYEYDFGDDNDTMPQGEWVELYNNSDVSHDLTDWYIWDDSGDSANKIEITAANTAPSSTVIGGHDWLVVYMNKEVFDNDGDTVKLFNQNYELIDSHTYTGNDYCEMEPTPGEGNTSDTDGSCGGVPPNKSYARIPDGVGDWVDPIPTPGGMNKLEEDIIEIETEAELTNIEATTTEATTTDELATSTETISENAETNEDVVEEPASELNTPASLEKDLIIPGEDSETGGETTEDVVEEVIGEVADEPTIDETGEETVEEIIEEAPVIEEPVIEEVPVIEEQPVIAPPENNSVEQAPPVDNSGDGGDGGSGDAALSE